MDVTIVILIAIALFVFFVLYGNYFIYENLANAKNTSFKISLAPVLLLITAPILILSSPILVAYRLLVSFILSCQYESKYCGLLEGRDSIYNLENENPVHLLFIVKYQNKNSQIFYDTVRHFINKVLEQKAKTNPKIFGAIRRYMGYSYILKNEITFDDCFRKLKTTDFPITKDDLLQLLGEYTSVPLPKNRQGLWDVFVGTQPVKWTEDVENDNAKHYPILFRMNHSFADGGHILAGILELFADNKEMKIGCSANFTQAEKSELTRSFSITSVLNFCVNLGMNLIFFVRLLGIACLSPSVSLVNALLADNSNILHGPKLTYRKHLFLNVEESPHYIQVVKRIKRKIPGCTFEDVCLAAIAASFKEYFQKNSSQIPEHIATEVPAVPIRLMRPEKPKVGEIFCRNRLTFAVRKLPINIDLETPNAVLNILLKIRREGTLIRLSLEHEINYFILKVICHLVPAPILRPFFDIVHNNTVLISNIPGPSFVTVMGGCPLQDIGAWTATRGYTGIGFAIFTYDDRLQLSMIVDKALISNRNNVQCLLDGVYKYLHVLEQQTMNISDKNTNQVVDG